MVKKGITSQFLHFKNSCRGIEFIIIIIYFFSAGVGRSGTYITLDTMLQRMAVTKDVNVYEFVQNMRMKRVFMVQTQVYTYV